MKNCFLKLVLCIAYTSFATALCGSAIVVPSDTSTPAKLTSTSTMQTAHVYFYRYHQFIGSALNPSVYCDGVQLARIGEGHYFLIDVPVGEHTITGEDKQAGAVLDMEQGQSYYFQLVLQRGFWKGHFRALQVMPSQGKYDIKKLKLLDKDQIIHNSLPTKTQTTK